VLATVGFDAPGVMHYLDHTIGPMNRYDHNRLICGMHAAKVLTGLNSRRQTENTRSFRFREQP
jgi:hypothetical protein